MITDYLKQGKENAVSLEYLAKASGVSKRKVRDEIICADPAGAGYYIAADLEEAKAYRAYNRSYWQSGIEKDKGIARCMERRFSGQIEMELK